MVLVKIIMNITNKYSFAKLQYQWSKDALNNITF